MNISLIPSTTNFMLFQPNIKTSSLPGNNNVYNQHFMKLLSYLSLGEVGSYAWDYLPIVSLTLFTKVWTEDGFSWLLHSHPHLGCRKNNISIPLSVNSLYREGM